MGIKGIHLPCNRNSCGTVHTLSGNYPQDASHCIAATVGEGSFTRRESTGGRTLSPRPSGMRSSATKFPQMKRCHRRSRREQTASEVKRCRGNRSFGTARILRSSCNGVAIPLHSDFSTSEECLSKQIHARRSKNPSLTMCCLFVISLKRGNTNVPCRSCPYGIYL
jgi:hypothetical protein